MVVLQEATRVAAVIPGQFSLILKTGKRRKCILSRSSTNANVLLSCWYASPDPRESHIHLSPQAPPWAGRASLDLLSLFARYHRESLTTTHKLHLPTRGEKSRAKLKIRERPRGFKLMLSGTLGKVRLDHWETSVASSSDLAVVFI